MGRITELPTCKVSQDDARINGHAWISRICVCTVENLREQRRLGNLASVKRRLTFDEENDNIPHAGPSKDTATPVVPPKDKSSIKWNFDFENETPLPGDWLWVKVSNNSSVEEQKSRKEISNEIIVNESHPEE